MILCPACGNFSDDSTCEVCGIRLCKDDRGEHKNEDPDVKVSIDNPQIKNEKRLT